MHSQGRVLADRSVLYKYLNRNLMAVVTSTPAKAVFTVYVVDSVSGRVIATAEHRKASSGGCQQLVLAENWLVYAYFNEKLRRVEIASMEFFEGKEQHNATAFSSIHHSPLPPMVETQSFIFPSYVSTLASTVTEKGITARHVLIGLPSGHVLDLPRAFLDPRRSIHPNREEALIPYVPELPMPMEALINYNETVSRIRAIECAPSALESTSLVLVRGLDIFWTRVTPSRPFDVLKEDFDYFLIIVVLAALVGGSYIGKKMAARKSLAQAWK